MNPALYLAEQLVIDRLLSDHAPLSHKSKLGLGFMALSVLLVVAGLGFLIFGAYIWLMANFPPETAAFLTGVTCLMTAVLLGLVAVAVLQYKRYRMRKFKKDIMETISSAMALLDEEIGEPIRDNPLSAVMISAVVGYLVSKNFIH